MRTLLIHAERFSFKSVSEAVEKPPDSPASGVFENCLVAFVTVEEGDGVAEARIAAGDIVSHARSVGAETIVVYPYAHLSSRLAKPEEAYRVLVELEKSIAELWRGGLARAPFGWYKAFELSCKGHPLAELSRSITGARAVSFRGVPLDEAASRGMLDERLLRKNPWRRDVAEAYSRLGFDSLYGRRARFELEELAFRALGLKKVARIAEPRWLYGLWGAASLAEACYKLEPGLLASWGDPGDSIASTSADPLSFISEIDPELSQLLERIEVGAGGLELPGVEGAVYAYKTREGGLAPLAAELKTVRCVGPLSSIILSLIDLGFRRAESGRTPTLPFWLSPIQVALLPVTEKQVDYVERVAEKLKEADVRVVVMKEGGLGARIREAGRSWVPLVAVAGEREAETGTLSVRMRWEEGKQEVVGVSEFLSMVFELKKAKRAG